MILLKNLQISLDTDPKTTLWDIKIIIERSNIDNNAVNSFNILATTRKERFC